MAVSNTTHERDGEEGAARMPATIVPLPGAAATPVVQTRTRGRMPRAIAQLHIVRAERDRAAWQQQHIARHNRRIQLLSEQDRMLAEFAELPRIIGELKRLEEQEAEAAGVSRPAKAGSKAPHFLKKGLHPY